MSVRKLKLPPYLSERRLDESFIHAERLLKSAAENVERSKKLVKRAKQSRERTR